MNAYLRLMRLDKPVGVLLTLWPALWALWIASHGTPDLRIFITIIIGAVVARSAGCIVNDYMDRDMDPHVERTQSRPLASKEISPKHAIIFGLILAMIGLLLAYSLSLYSFYIALGAAVVATLYPLMKRITYMPQLILGIVFNAGVLMAFTATQNHIPSIAWLIYITTIIWTIAYDTMYAMSDREDDLKIGVKSTAILFGKRDTLIILILQIIVAALLFCIGFKLNLNGAYYIAWVACVIIQIFQQSLIQKRDRQDCFKAFRIAQHIGWVLLLGICFSI